MARKNFCTTNQKKAFQEIISWKLPKIHEASEWYISLEVFDPARGKMRLKKFMLGRYKTKREKRLVGEQMVKNFTEKLMNGWNPWIETSHPQEYTFFDEVCRKYQEYLFKMLSEGNMREESVTSYVSRLRMLMRWKEEKNEKLFYSYQFDSTAVGRFLDYIFIDRNNTIRTRNNYLSWLKVFGKYLFERGYVPANPTEGYGNVRIRNFPKNRSVIPDALLVRIREWLSVHQRHYLLACYILHYLFVRPKEMSYLKVGDFSITKKTLTLHGNHTKNRCDAVLTLPDHVLKLMIDLRVFDSPGNNYLFSEGFAPGPERRSEKVFRDYWCHYVRKELGFSAEYKFYSLKDTGITNMLRANTDILSVRDQARHSSILITDIYTPKDIRQANELMLRYEGLL